jgi:hypothetical protein
LYYRGDEVQKEQARTVRLRSTVLGDLFEILDMVRLLGWRLFGIPGHAVYGVVGKGERRGTTNNGSRYPRVAQSPCPFHACSIDVLLSGYHFRVHGKSDRRKLARMTLMTPLAYFCVTQSRNIKVSPNHLIRMLKSAEEAR